MLRVLRLLVLAASIAMETSFAGAEAVFFSTATEEDCLFSVVVDSEGTLAAFEEISVEILDSSSP